MNNTSRSLKIYDMYKTQHVDESYCEFSPLKNNNKMCFFYTNSYKKKKVQ